MPRCSANTLPMTIQFLDIGYFIQYNELDLELAKGEC